MTDQEQQEMEDLRAELVSSRAALLTTYQVMAAVYAATPFEVRHGHKGPEWANVTQVLSLLSPWFGPEEVFSE